MKNRSLTRQAGFTLVEIAIVLVIIGLLLGGVLKGQELIEGARIKNAIKDMDGVSSAVNAYVDRFHRMPGDDGPLATLTARGGSWTSVTQGGNNDGIFNPSTAQVFTGGGEGTAFWQALKAAGFVTGNPADAGVASLPRNAFNGLVGVGVGVTPTVGGAQRSVCLSQVPGKSARAIDTQLDDGIPNTGSVMATLTTVGGNPQPAAAAATYVDGNFYTVCRTL